jgi:rhodanese-related sulfurtransferase
MKLTSSFIGYILFIISCTGQVDLSQISTLNDAFDEKIKSHLDFTVPVISCEALNKESRSFLILDTREREEYQVSHIPGAVYVGYNQYDFTMLESIPRDQPIVVYCSIGYRSEKIGEKLKERGFTGVYNLYGSIFEWTNRGFPLIDDEGKETLKIHTYNKQWSRWVDAPDVEKIW